MRRMSAQINRPDRPDRSHRGDGRCRTCGGPIVGRPATATTCLIHRKYPSPPTRDELVALLKEHETAVAMLREALAAMDEGEDVEPRYEQDGEVSA